MSSAYLNIATKAAYLAGNLIQQGSRNLSNIKIERKGKNDFVTELDRKSEEIIKKTILQVFPNHNILGEEFGYTNQDSEYTWIIDPLDGTTNFIHSYPHYSISIALKHKNQLLLGIVFDPNRNDLYKAELGKGAFLNDKRIRVSSNSFEYSLITTGCPSHDPKILDQYLNIFREITLNASGHRMAGSAALDLAYIAAGFVDGYWEYDLKSWDISAGILIVRESGGIVNNFLGDTHNSEHGSIIAATPKIINKLQKIIEKYYKE